MPCFARTDFTPPRWQARHARAGGFTLVEIAIAIAVIAVGLVAILGLLPAGMNTFRDSMDTAIGAQIVQRVTSTAQQTDFKTLTDFAAYFDDQGGEVDRTSPTRLYDVRVLVEKDAELPVGTQSANLARLVIQIANNPAGREIPIDPDTRRWSGTGRPAVRTYPGFVARNRGESK